MVKCWAFVCCAAFLLLASTSTGTFNEEDYRIVFPNNEDEGSLKLVSVIFRHGNRTPSGINELYPNDPHLNFTYFPYGHGQLTQTGKLKLYTIGVSLRNRYNTFLGKYYYPEIVEAITTDYNRTKMSLELLLAGLFPPRQDEVMTTGLTWQPIPYNFLPRSDDKILLGDNCPRYKQLYEEYSSTPKVQSKLKQYQPVIKYLTEHTGKEMSTFKDIYELNFGLSIEEEYGLALPDWTKSVWPEPISTLASEEYFVQMGLQEMKKMAVGYFLEKILNEAVNKINDSNKLSRKIHLYSAHESNLAQLLMTLGIFEKPHVPKYGSYIAFELHKIDGVYGFKLYYEAWDGRGLTLMKIPQCKEFCPLDIFRSLILEYLPTDNLCGN